MTVDINRKINQRLELSDMGFKTITMRINKNIWNIHETRLSKFLLTSEIGLGIGSTGKSNIALERTQI